MGDGGGQKEVDGTYSLSSGPKAMYFQPWAPSVGNAEDTTLAAGKGCGTHPEGDAGKEFQELAQISHCRQNVVSDVSTSYHIPFLQIFAGAWLSRTQSDSTSTPSHCARISDGPQD